MLYKYRSFNSRGLKEIFSKNEIFFSSPKNFNDPFDCKPNFYIDKALETQIGLVTTLADMTQVKEEIKKDVFAAVQNGINSIAVLSLSKTWEDIVMWSHYANEHKGICLGFNFEISSNPIFKTLEDVQYPENKELPIFNLDEFYDDSNDDYEEFAKDVLLTKYVDWQYEKEVRAVAQKEDTYNFEKECLTRIYLGANISEENELLVNHWRERYMTHVDLIKLKYSPTKYAVVVT